MDRVRSVHRLTLAATIITLVAGLWVAFWPGLYQGISVEVEIGTTGESGTTREESASLVEVEGWGVLPLLEFPVILSGAAFVGARLLRRGSRRLAALLVYGAAIAMLAFCLLAILTIGLFYVPSALALIAAAFLFPRQAQA